MAKQQGVSRRVFMERSSLVLMSAGGLMIGSGAMASEEGDKPLLKVGMITDIHYADKPARGTRVYRDGLMKVGDAVKSFNQQEPSFVVQLGDFIDAADSLKTEIKNLKAIEEVYAKLKCPRYYVLGNHCVHKLKKEEFVAHTGMQKTYHSFDRGGVHFVILDACFREADEADYGRDNFQWHDSVVPKKELAWLKADLKATDKPVIVFAHQRLDGDYQKDRHFVKNAKAVREILEAHGSVRAVFQGHSHANAHQAMGGIDYVTLKASVEKAGLENKAYAMLEIYSDGKLVVQGFGQQVDYAIKG